MESITTSLPQSTSPVALLLVDDRNENLLALQAILAPLGHELVSVSSGEEAIARARTREFAAILLDVRMPGMDGFSTAREIKARGRSRLTPIIFLTANDSPEDVAHAYAHGGIDFMPKPLNPTVLTAKAGIFVELFQQRMQIAQHEVERLMLQERTDALREHAQLLALDAEVARALGAHGTLESALAAVSEAIVRHLDSAFARIWIASQDGAMLELRASAGMYTHLDGAHGRVPVGSCNVGKIAATRSPIVSNEVLGDADFGEQAWVAREKMVAFAGYPLVLGDELLGVIATFARHPFSSRALLALQSTAGVVAQGIQRLRAEARLQASATWFSTTLTGIGDGVIATDANGVVTFLNPVAADLTRWRPDEAKGHPLDEVFPIVNEATRVTVESPVSKVIREGTVVGMANHTVLLRRDGSEIPIADSAAPIRDAAGALIGVVLVFRDASEQRRVELEHEGLLAEAVRAREALEQIVAERERLLGAAEENREKADVANRMKDEFLATASHELRTPLNAILGWARMLRSGKCDQSGYMRGLETIERNATSQVQLIEDILDGSRMITGKLHLEPRSLDMTALVRAALDAVRPAVDAKNIAMSVVVDPAATRVLGDPERLQQVIWNLANNAVKFTPKGGTIEVRLERSGTYIELSVTDSGQGISADFLPHVFERFRQADGSTTRRHGGLGLGLALVRHIVEAHGGSVHAESDGAGKGARFRVLLPVQAVFTEAQRAEGDTRRSSDVGLATPAPPRLDGISVLVVDDEADARDLVATMLRANGAEVTTAASAALAIQSLSSSTPMVLISDVGMPERDGYDLIREVRAFAERAGHSQIPAIALTAYSREEDRRRALEAGFDTHVVKPASPDELLRIVAGAVHAAKLRLAAVPGAPPMLDRADTFSKFDKLLTTRGIHEALRFLNSRTSHRFTGIFRFDGATLRNVSLVDSDTPEVRKGEDAPMSHTYCSIVGESQRTFTTEDARSDDRLRAHPARDSVISYCGVLLRDDDGKPYGTLCHFDFVPCDIPARELTMMEAAAPHLIKALRAL